MTWGKKRKFKYTKPNNVLAKELLQQADLANQAKDYRKSLKAYKKLYQIEKSEDAKTLLEKAYLNRARELAKKHLYCEACAFWVSRQRLDPLELCLHDYINWLIGAKDYSKIFSVLADYQSQEDPQTLAEMLLPDMALPMLLYPESYALLTGTPFDAQRQLALQALDSFSLHPDSLPTLESDIDKISFRSPYKTLRQLLKVFARFTEDPDHAQKLATPLLTYPPYNAIAQVLITSMDSGPNLLQALLSLRPKQRLLLSHLKGWSQEELKRNEQMADVLAGGTDKNKYNFFEKHQALFDQVNRHSIGLSMLLGYAAGDKVAKKNLGLTAFDHCRLKALRYEKQGKIDEADDAWDDCVDILKQSKQTPSIKKKIGLIIVHQAELLHRGGICDEYFCQKLLESLDYLPDRRETYLLLYKTYKDEKHQKRYLDAALKRFPNDIEFLLLAAREAMAKASYTKAQKLATAILQQDKIHIEAKQILALSAAASIRKWLSKKSETQLKKNFLKLIPSLNQVSETQHLPPLFQYFCSSQTDILCLDDALSTDSLLQDAWQRLGGNAYAEFIILLETETLGLEVKAMSKRLCVFYTEEHGVKEIAQLISILLSIVSYAKQHNQTDSANVVLHFQWEKFTSLLKGRLTQAQYIEILECLHALSNYDKIRFILKRAEKSYPNMLLTVYYDFIGRYGDRLLECLSPPDFQRLQRAYERDAENAPSELKRKVAALLRRVLKKHIPVDMVHYVDEMFT